MIKAGRFGRVLKKDGTLLFKPYFRDSAFLVNITHLYHSVFLTEFFISHISQTAKGFHIRLKETSNDKDALFLEGEEFSLPEREVVGKSVDTFIGLEVVDKKGMFVGKVESYIKTPEYYLLSVESQNGNIMVPFIKGIAEFSRNKVVIDGERFAN